MKDTLCNNIFEDNMQKNIFLWHFGIGKYF